MISVSQNRFQAPQRIARNNQTANHNRTAQAQPAFKGALIDDGIDFACGAAIAGAIMAIIALIPSCQGAYNTEKERLTPIVDSMSGHKINKLNIDNFVETRAAHLKAAELNKQAAQILKKNGIK